MTELTTFASGSSGNCALLTSCGSGILIDAGISLRRINAGLSARGLRLSALEGVFITHEHADHVSGLPMLLKRTEVKIFAPHTVASRLMGMFPGIEDRLEVIHISRPRQVGELSVTAFHTRHDTPESVGYRADGEASVGFCTDLGCVTDEVREGLCGVSAAVIEANHDEEMLRYGPYPVYLKRRILSDEGHLSNARCGALAAFLAENGAETLVLGHLSRENNTPAKALAAVSSALEERGLSPRVLVAPPAEALTVEAMARCSV